jgi:hypothetical protein
MTNQELYEQQNKIHEKLDKIIDYQQKIELLANSNKVKYENNEDQINGLNKKFKMVYISIFGSSGFIITSISILKFLNII